MSKHPYQSLPAHTRWSRAIASVAPEDVDPAVGFPFQIPASSRIATAGSCFAQNIARRLDQGGLNHFVVEPGHPLGDDGLRHRFNYGIYSARYGNIYTPRQLLQLFERAFGHFVPHDQYWSTEQSTFIDPLRPTIQPNGFASREELEHDRRQHLACVRHMFEEVDYFIFTLGLTEAWRDHRDGTVYPLCPGVAGGVFDGGIHKFINFDLKTVVADLQAFILALGRINASARVILTVSPVPLIATAVDRHVLTSTLASKSILRVACEEICTTFPHVAYFPAYEIIVGPHAPRDYFDIDRRSVSEAGVEHVMRIFFRHALAMNELPKAERKTPVDNFISQSAAVSRIVCDEEMIEASLALKTSRAENH